MTEAKIDKRTQVIEKALELFTSQGLQQTSMAQISKESGVAVGTIYLNFKSKDELIERIFLMIQENFGKAVELTNEELELSFEEQFYLIGQRAYNFYVHHPEQFYFIDTLNYSPLISKETREEGRTSYKQAIQILSEGMERGHIQQIPRVLLIRLIYNGIISLVQIKLSDNEDVDEKLLNQTIAMILKGLQ